MKKFLFLVLVASVAGWGLTTDQDLGIKATKSTPPEMGTSQPSHGSGAENEREKSKRESGDGLPESIKDIVETINSSDSSKLTSATEDQIKGLSDEEKDQLLAEIDSQLRDGGGDTYKEERLRAVKKIIESESEEKTATAETKPAATAPAKPAGVQLQTAGSHVVVGDTKVPVHKIPTGNGKFLEVSQYLGTDGKPVKTADGQDLVIVGDEGASQMHGIFPASAFGLKVGEAGKIFTDPTAPSMQTVSTGKEPQINSAVPVIFSNGQAYARQGVADGKGNQTTYWSNEKGNLFSMGAESGANVVTVSQPQLPEGLALAGTDKKYLTVAATRPEAPAGLMKREEAGRTFYEAATSEDRLAFMELALPSLMPPSPQTNLTSQQQMAKVTELATRYVESRPKLAPPEATAPQTATVSGAPENGPARLTASAAEPPQKCNSRACELARQATFNSPQGCYINASGQKVCPHRR